MRRYIVAWWCVAACGSREPERVDNDGDGVIAELDCDDSDPERSPEAQERCDGVDNDCDLEIDDSPVDGIAGYEDNDGDGFGAEPAVIVACQLSPSLVDRGGDCDDASAEVKPGAQELCDGLDNDCDPETGEAGLVTVGGQNAAGLQEALDAAVSGDTVRLCEGTWPGSTYSGSCTVRVVTSDAGRSHADAARPMSASSASARAGRRRKLRTSMPYSTTRATLRSSRAPSRPSAISVRCGTRAWPS